ncbi:hypothetical protein A0J61_04986, partial [Choanephora cucurbitarum]
MGDLGWHWGLKFGDALTHLTQRRLFQRYLVDDWAICDQNKLDWIKNHQSDIRANLYNGLQDVLINDDVNAACLGRQFILLSSYTGDPRFMAKSYQDSMAIRKSDQAIPAELPSRELDLELYEIITKNMVHDPCGSINPKSPCMTKDINGQLRCTKRFPKAYSEETLISENGYPVYKRSTVVDSANLYSVPNPLRNGFGCVDIDNRWIVPYNPYLSKKHKAHINVECCRGVEAIKYINKYVYKGSDRSTLRLSDTRDEINKHLQGRYIGPTEAFARLFEYKMHEEDPTVASLAFHLPNEQPVYFPEDANTPEIHNPTAQKCLYQEFTKYFVWDQKRK